MLQRATRALPRSAPLFRTSISRPFFPRTGRRFASTAPADKPRSWRSSATRWGVVVAGLYYYNSSKMFAEEPVYAVHLPETDRETETMPTIDELAEQRRQQALARQSTNAPSVTSSQNVATAPIEEASASAGSPQELEEEAEGEGAFNPETGEINWECPCLGGMAHGPCGEQFKAAFSCFVYSKEEPKGIDCIDNFKNMQDCFRQYPEVYGAELEGDEEEEELMQNSSLGEQPSSQAAQPKDVAVPAQPIPSSPAENASDSKVAEQRPASPSLTPEEIQQKRQRAKSASQQVKTEYPVTSETEEAVPKAWHDTKSSNDGK